MVDVYVTLIVYGVYTLDDVIEPQYEEVKEKLTAMGLDGKGHPIK